MIILEEEVENIINNNEEIRNETDNVDDYLDKFLEIYKKENMYKGYTVTKKTIEGQRIITLTSEYKDLKEYSESPLMLSNFLLEKFEKTDEYTLLKLEPGYYYSMFFDVENRTNMFPATFRINLGNKVLETNATKIDATAGVYEWSMPLEENIYIKYSNIENIKEQKISSNNNLLYVIIGCGLVLTLVIGLTIYGKVARNNEI